MVVQDRMASNPSGRRMMSQGMVQRLARLREQLGISKPSEITPPFEHPDEWLREYGQAPIVISDALKSMLVKESGI